MSFEPILDEMLMANHNLYLVFKRVKPTNFDHQALYSDIQRKASDIEEQMRFMAESTKACKSRTVLSSIEKSSIASPSDPLVQRRLNFEFELPKPVAASELIDSRDCRGIFAAPA